MALSEKKLKTVNGRLRSLDTIISCRNLNKLSLKNLISIVSKVTKNRRIRTEKKDLCGNSADSPFELFVYSFICIFMLFLHSNITRFIPESCNWNSDKACGGHKMY